IRAISAQPHFFRDYTMTGTQTIRMLARYNAWANKTMFNAVFALPSGEAAKQRPTLFKNMVNTLNHVYVVDLIWQAHLQGREHGIAAPVSYTHLRAHETRHELVCRLLLE